MILDPRLVPWSAMLTGIGVAAPFAIAGYRQWKRRPLALTLLTLAPVAGWTASFLKLQGRLPSLPPLDAPMWAFYFAWVGCLGSLLGFWKRSCSGCIGPLARMIFFPALWMLVFKPVFHFDLASFAWKALAFGLIGMGIIGLWHKKAARWPAAEFTPWLTALTAGSICLSLTGAASLGMLALALCFASLPGAVAVLAASLHKYDLPLEAENFSLVQKTVWLPPDSQALTLPLAFALPVLTVSGPLYASTGWGIACLILASPVSGFMALRFYTNRRMKNPAYIPTWRSHLGAIAVAVVAAAIPAFIAVSQVVSAAAEDPYY